MMSREINSHEIFRKIFLITFVCLLIISGNASAQKDSSASAKKYITLPVLSLGQGLINFIGDVGYSKFNEPLTSRSGFQIEIQPQTKSRLSFSFFLLSGRVIGEEKTISRAMNFRSSIVSEGIMLRYDFRSKKRDDQVLIPFVTAGAEYLYFKSRTDLRDANNNYYNYWSDGSIRNMSQDDSTSSGATIVYRDYKYETDIRDANLDGFGKYRTSTWGVPVGAGVLFQLSDRCAVNISSVYHITGTDYIDGVTADSKGSRAGNDRKDKLVYTSLSLRFALSSPHNDDYRGIDFNALVNEDADGDGIPDIADDSSGTPQHNGVYANGKPFDNDNDGIPDYRDSELNSASDAVVNEEGVTITEEMVEEKFRKDSLAALPSMIEYLRSYDKLTQRNPDVEKKWMDKNGSASKSPDEPNPVPALYLPLDLDRNGTITPKEISLAIDDYLAKKSPYSIPQFFDLIDFFFSQK